jgi:phage tail-like protein
MKSFGDTLYSLLPSFYRNEDSKISPNPYPLQRYLQIAGVSFDYLKDKIDSFKDLFDPDKCPAELLPYLPEFYGIKMPFSMSEGDMRKFIKILPDLMAYKGQDKAFTFLAREIFGSDTQVSAYRQAYTKGMAVSDWRKIFVNVTADGEKFSVGNRQVNFVNLAEIIRPVNRYLIMSYSLFYSESVDILNAIALEYHDVIISTANDTDTPSIGFTDDSSSYYFTPNPSILSSPKNSLVTNFKLCNPNLSGNTNY